MSDQELVCGNPECGKEVDEPFKILKGKVACSARCAGHILAGIAQQARLSGEKKESKGKTRQQLRNKMLRENAQLLEGWNIAKPKEDPTPPPFHIAPEDTVVPTKVPGWGQVAFNRNIYKAMEVTILVKVSDDMMVRVFGFMKDVYAYTDPKMGGILLRPNMGSVKRTFDDFPKAIEVAKRPFAKRVPKEERLGEDKPEKAVARVVTKRDTDWAAYANPCQSSSSQRFFFVESMKQGGTGKEIVARADEMAAKAGAWKKGAIIQGIGANRSNMKYMAKWLVGKWVQKGIRGKIEEVGDNVWKVELPKP